MCFEWIAEQIGIFSLYIFKLQGFRHSCKNCEKLPHICRSVLLSAWKIRLSLDEFSLKFIFELFFFENLQRKLKFY
jgi:hypothetical protein